MSGKSGKSARTTLTVGAFLEAGVKDLQVELLAGKAGLARHIVETTLNRPGLAITGFFRHFPHKRVQVLGWAEYDYLSSLVPAERDARLRDFFARKMPAVVLARGRRPMDALLRLAEAARIPVLRTRMITKHFVNAATILMENLSAPRAKTQGTMLEIQGIGVLIEGKPGMGKSEAALALLRRGAALVSDDVTALRIDSAGALLASAVDVTRYHMDIRGVGIIHVPSLFGVASVRGEKKLELVVTLCEPGECRVGEENIYARSTRRVLGTEVSRVFVPVAPGRDIANVVETAALDYKLRLLGHDAEKELDAHLIATMSRGRNGSE